MNLRKAVDYTIGLDIGTGSVGWAVVDEEGRLYYIKGKPTWGSRLFDSADTAANTRLKRGQRRRYERRRQRLDELQEIFCEEMANVDEEFFIRLRQSRLIAQDRAEDHREYRWPLFNDTDFDEAQYYWKYPTIYHLRLHLMECGEKEDLRLVYLALHHIVKYRGNFLHEDEGTSLTAKTASASSAALELVDALTDYVQEISTDDLEYDIEPDDELIARALDEKGLSSREKAERMRSAIGAKGNAKDFAKLVGNACVGFVVDFAKLFEGVESSTDTKFKMSDEEKCETFADEMCPDEAQRLFRALRSAYSSFVLSGILKGASSISAAMVASYDRHDEDLKTLKGLFRDYLPRETYLEFFRGDLDERGDYDTNKLAKDTYTSYIAGEKLANGKGTTHESLMKRIRKLCDSCPQLKADDRYRAIAERIENGDESDFLLKQRIRDNGAIPYQLHLEEAMAIIDRQGAFYPFLLENKELIGKLISSRIPYYVGPLNTNKDPLENYRQNTVDATRKFAWSVRKPGTEGIAAHPWNVDEVIDTDVTAERFIRKMTGTCTYLLGAPVLPRHSLLYEEFCVLNELNGARWCALGKKERRFDAKDKALIVDELFCRRKSVSYSAVANLLERKHGLVDPEVMGGQGETGFESKLTTYGDFCKIFGVKRLEDAPLSFDELEEIVLWNTVFEDRAIFKRKVRDKYGSNGDGRVSDTQLKKIVSKRYAGWGRLSQALLTKVTVPAHVDGGVISIIDVLRDGNPFEHNRQMVFMEVVTDKNLGFEARIAELNQQKIDAGETTLTVDDLQGSPANRRAVNQALRIVEELVSIPGCPPKRICIEVTRDDDLKKKGSRTTTRYRHLKDALKAFKADKELLDDLERKKADLDDDRLFLYFEQQGKCLYSHDSLDINSLSLYQIDHILPQSYIKDDSLANRVLVRSSANQRKLDDLLLETSIINARRSWWRSLKDAGLMSEKKFKLLTRTHLDERQLQGFINRQLVETSQIVKFVRLMLEQRYPDTEIVSVRSSVSHGVRDNLDLPKSRELNNYHHAHDAFIACQVADFVGRVYPKWQDGFSLARMRKYQSELNPHINPSKMVGRSGFIADSMTRIRRVDDVTGEILWDSKERADYLRRVLQFKDCFVSRRTEIQTGAFWKETVYSPRDSKYGKNLEMPLKSSAKQSNYEGILSPGTYGGVSSVKKAYWFIYSAKDRRGNVKYFFEGVPVYRLGDVERFGLQSYADECARRNDCSDARLMCDRKICLRQKFELDGIPYYLYGQAGNNLNEIRPARELTADITLTKKIVDLFEEEPKLNDSALIMIYEWLISKSKLLSMHRDSMIDLKGKYSSFLNLSQNEKIQQLQSIINLVNGSAQVANLRPIGGSASAGRIKKNLQSLLARIVWIDQSVTGIFEYRTTFKEMSNGI